MAVTNYHTVDGEIIGETTGGIRSDYMSDAIGSVTGTTQGGAVQNTYRYKPYGGLLAKTGTAADPMFLWNGGSGYRATGRPHSDSYVRGRHYSAADAAWPSTDRYWPRQRPFAYAHCSPASISDPSGNAPPVQGCPSPVRYFGIGAPYNCSSCANCSNISLRADWCIPPGATGWVVQKVTFTPGGSKCGGRSCDTNPPICTPSLTYWERWLIVGGGLEVEYKDGQTGPAQPWDQWDLPGCGTAQSSGQQTEYGEARIVTSIPASSVWHFKNQNSTGRNSCAGDLPTADSYPGWDGLSGRPLARTMTYRWTCCSCKTTAPTCTYSGGKCPGW